MNCQVCGIKGNTYARGRVLASTGEGLCRQCFNWAAPFLISWKYFKGSVKNEPVEKCQLDKALISFVQTDLQWKAQELAIRLKSPYPMMFINQNEDRIINQNGLVFTVPGIQDNIEP